MKPSSVKWSVGWSLRIDDRIGCIRRVHAQNHAPTSKQKWGRNDTRKPWFCKSFQTKSCSHPKDHETNGKWHHHIFAFCLTLGNTNTTESREGSHTAPLGGIPGLYL